MSAVRECPFCGEHAQLHSWEDDDVYLVACDQCDANTRHTSGASDAIAAWNRRAGDDEIAALRAEVERLREALANMVGQWGQEPCPVCGGDCASANPPISMCPVIAVMRARAALEAKR